MWLAAFTLQAADVLALVVPDTCTAETAGSANDPCPDACPRCLCCARVTVFISSLVESAATEVAGSARFPVPLEPSTTASPLGIFHIPKTSLI